VRTPSCFDDREARQRIKALCEQNSIDLKLLTDLCEVTQGYSGSGRKDGVMSDLTEKFDEFLQRDPKKPT
jgi:hypothetical protein